MVQEVWTNNPKQNVVMLPQTFRNGNMIDDIHLFRMIAEKLNDPRIIVIPDCYGSDIQQQIIRNAKYVIGARYHSIVFAINQNVPFIALSYEHKISGLLAALGKEDSMIDFTSAMLSKEKQQHCLSGIREMLPNLRSDENAQKKAYQVAHDGFRKFIERYNIG